MLALLSDHTGRRKNMAKKGNTVIVKLRSSESEYRYYTRKNKKNTTGRMELMKYDPNIRKHVSFKEER